MIAQLLGVLARLRIDSVSVAIHKPIDWALVADIAVVAVLDDSYECRALDDRVVWPFVVNTSFVGLALADDA